MFKNRRSLIGRLFSTFPRPLQTFQSKPIESLGIPYVIESSPKGERVFDIFSRLLKDRIVFLNGQVEDSISTIIVAQLLFLEAEAPNKPISFYINSPGGSVTAGMAIYDTMQCKAIVLFAAYFVDPRYFFSCCYSLYWTGLFNGIFAISCW